MSDDTAPRELSRSAFQESFGKLEPVILAEWQQLDAGALTATGGELDKVVALIAERTAHTKVLVRRQLEELWQVAAEPLRRRKGATAASRLRDNLHAVLPDAADDVLQELEQRTAELIRELRGGLLKDTRTRVKDNLLFSLLVTLGLGFIVGVIFTGWNFRRER
jgi:hypothetical protein